MRQARPSRRAFQGWEARLLALSSLGLGLGLSAVGCTPHIGDRCTLNTDCSISNTRQCDNSQPNGYCTIFNCGPNSCPDQGACVMFLASVPGCGYDDYSSPSRTGVSFCMKGCQSDSDCRQGDGYACKQLADLGVTAISLDTYSNPRVCAIPPDVPESNAGTNAAVCPGSPIPPDAGAGYFDGGSPAEDGGTEEGGSEDGGVDAASDAAADAPPEDAAVDGGADATVDGSADATVDGPSSDAAEAAADDAGGGG
jgi:hypothetical protein